MDQFVEMFTKFYKTICEVVLTFVETIRNLVSSITNPDDGETKKA